MSEARIVFTLEGADLTMQCSSEEKMRDICQKYATKIDKNMDSLVFLYEGNKVNFDLSLKDQACSSDGNKNEIKIIVKKIEDATDTNEKIDEFKTKVDFVKPKKCKEENNNSNNHTPLKNIKSEFFIQKLFCILNEKIKLKVIIYNKKLQEINDISLINYKFFSVRYIIYETKTKGKEYDRCSKDLLLFEGEYLNGKRNGKGKEYDKDGKLIFEGEYLNGKRNGKGKEYNDDGILIFEGKYLNGKRWDGIGYDKNNNIVSELKEGKGAIKEYDKYGKLIFEGEYLNGERHGKGKEYYYDGTLKFDGEYLNGKRHYRDGEFIFEGEYLYGNKWNGKYYYLLNNNVIEIKNGKGLIKEYDDYGKLEYEGEYLNGQINGKGKQYYYNNKLEFEGEYLYGYKLKGKQYYYDGKLEFEGEYLYGNKWNGKGKEYGKDGLLIFEGEYLKGERWNGEGKEYDKDGFLIYEGEYLNGKRHGIGKEYNDDGKLIFDGEYLNGERHGKGKEYYYDGTLKFDGEYLNGKRHNMICILVN